MQCCKCCRTFLDKYKERFDQANKMDKHCNFGDLHYSEADKKDLALIKNKNVVGLIEEINKLFESTQKTLAATTTSIETHQDTATKRVSEINHGQWN
jgi:hypothetical protein